MNIFNKIALQGLKKNRTRTIVTVIGVILSSLMITGVTTFGVSLLDYMAKGALLRYGNWYAAFLDADATFAQERMRDKEVSGTASFENIGYAALDGGQNPNKPYIFVAGFGQDAFDLLPVSILSGRYPENGAEIMISAKLAADGGISCQVGDTIVLSVGSRMKDGEELTQITPYTAGEEELIPREQKSYTVVGICRTPVFEPEEAPGYTLITRSDGAEQSAAQSLFVTLKTPGKVYSYADKVKGGHACMLNYDVLRIMGISDHPADRVFMAFLYSFGGIVLAIIMTGSVFLIYNSFSISLSERIREIGVLASVGATAKQLRNSVLFEGVCIGAAGIPIGILAGLGSMSLILSAVSDNFGAILFEGISIDMKVSALAVFGAAIVSMVTVLISAWLPAKKAVNLPVMECIRQTNEIKVRLGDMEISRRQKRMYGLEGVLALKNFKRNKKRYRSVVLSLVLSIVLSVAADALIASMRQTAGRYKTVCDYDIGFGTKEMGDAELLSLYDKLKNVHGVQESSCRAVIPFSCTVLADRLTDDYWQAAGGYSAEAAADLPAKVHFFDDAFYRKLVRKLGLSEEEYTGQNGKLPAVAKISDDSAEVKGAEDLKDMFRENCIELAVRPCLTDETQVWQGRDVTITAVEFTPPDIPPLMDSAETEALPYTFEILAPWSLKETLAPSGLPIDLEVKGLCFNAGKASQVTNKMRDIITAEGITSPYTLLNGTEAFEQFRNYIFIANVFTYIFIALIALIAAANVFNTISTNIRLRRRELAMLRSVGMSDKDFNKMMCFECMFYGTKALLIGVPLSLLCSVLIVRVMSAEEAGFALPWAGLLISAAGVFLVIFVTMMYAVSKIKKDNIIDALRNDMT